MPITIIPVNWMKNNYGNPYKTILYFYYFSGQPSQPINALHDTKQSFFVQYVCKNS